MRISVGGFDGEIRRQVDFGRDRDQSNVFQFTVKTVLDSSGLNYNDEKGYGGAEMGLFVHVSRLFAESS